MIFITTMMKQASSGAGLFWRRAILVVGALLSLCVSDSAGPRLLPLPAPSVPLAINGFSANSDTRTSPTPNPNREPNTYFQMVAGSQYRARDRHYHAQPATHAPEASVDLKPGRLTTTTETYAHLIFRTASLSIPTGRAPPRLA